MSDLGGLVHASYENLDRWLLCAFVERWHANTHTHISFTHQGDDHQPSLLMMCQICCICPLLVNYTHQTLDADSTNDLLVEFLRVDSGVVSGETRHYRGANVRLSWLRDVYEDACSMRQWIVTARAYLLHLVGCTIFADKSATSISVIYLGFFVNLRLTGGYAWATTALTHMCARRL